MATLFPSRPVNTELRPESVERPDLPFHVRCAPDYDSLSGAAAAHLIGCLRSRPNALFILAAGDSPAGAYRAMAVQGGCEPALCARIRLMKLDEWGGLCLKDPASCETTLRQALVEPLGIGPDRFFGWNSEAADLGAECDRQRRWLEANGPADICVLGLGLNGHLGFNEPADEAVPWPHRAELAEMSRRHSMLQQAQGTPAFGLTLGMRDLLTSREIVLVVTGRSKRPLLRRLCEPRISPQFPASFLWLHPAVTIYCDRAAWPEPDLPS